MAAVGTVTVALMQTRVCLQTIFSPVHGAVLPPAGWQAENCLHTPGLSWCARDGLNAVF